MDHKNETFYKFCWNFFSYKKHYYCRCKTDCSKYCFISDVHSKYYNFFSIGVISMNKFLIAQKHSLCLFSRKKIEFVCFPRIWPRFSLNNGDFRLKTYILMGNRQTNFFYTKMKSLNKVDAFSSPKCYNVFQNDNFLWVWTRDVKLGKTPNFQFWTQNVQFCWNFMKISDFRRK